MNGGDRACLTRDAARADMRRLGLGCERAERSVEAVERLLSLLREEDESRALSR